MRVPQFSHEIQNQIAKLFYRRGTSPKNPLDVSVQFYDMENLYNIFDLALSDEIMDAMIFDIPGWYFDPHYRLRKYDDWEGNLFKALSLGQKFNKPIFVVIQRTDFLETRYNTVKKLRELKIPVFGQPKEFLPFLQEMNKNFEKWK